ncbi:histidine phosphatase family protein [Kiloniella sp. EL199]|uniref:SixA phosphatase family protein n=1 Tax=Kiloniella sp. EL199 TaxID=2107581 RepID=UPI000EA142C0|nr:histidine phosphatase family protein [Kiloniella sp. EL199]
MKKIYLARHATTHHAQKEQQDRDRPLTTKGREEAYWLGQKIKDVPPSIIISSSAIRAIETSEIILEILDSDILDPSILDRGIELVRIPELYLAPSQIILRNLAKLSNKHETALLVGHNPGLSQFLFDISGPSSDRTALQRVYGGLPPAGFGILKSNLENWTDLTKINTGLEKIYYPGE